MASSSRQGRKHARYVSESSSTEDEPEQLHPHPLLHFEPGTHARAILARLVNTPLQASRVIDWQLMEQLGVRQRLSEIFTPRWRSLVDLPSRQFVELTLEFFSTFTLHLGELSYDSAVQFRLGGTFHSISIARFAVLMSLYTEAEVTQPIFTESLRTVGTTVHPYGISQRDLIEWWPTIGDSVWRPSCPASWIRDPLFRYVHRIITTTLTGRHLSIEKMSELDLFIVYCLLRPAPANLATILLTSLARNRGKSARICQGPYITRLAERLGVFVQLDIDSLTPGPPTTPVRVDDMIQMGIVTAGRPYRLVPARAPVLPPAPEGPAAEHFQPIAQPPQRQPRTRPAPAAAATRPITLEHLWAGQTAIQARMDRQDRMIRLMMTHMDIPIPPEFREPPAANAPEDRADP